VEGESALLKQSLHSSTSKWRHFNPREATNDDSHTTLQELMTQPLVFHGVRFLSHVSIITLFPLPRHTPSK